jgi:hypothetical protein
MKNVLSWLTIMLAGISLAGCSATPLTQEQVDLQSKSIDAQVACYERLQAQDGRIATMLARVPEDQIALVMVLQSMQENNKALMAIATGNEYNPCSTGTTAFDVQIAEVQSKNAAASSITSSAFGLGKWIVGGYTIGAVADKISGDTITATGGSEINQNAKNTTVNALGNGSATTSHTSNPSPDNRNTTGTTDNSNNNGAVAPEPEEEFTGTPECSVESRAAGRC